MATGDFTLKKAGSATEYEILDDKKYGGLFFEFAPVPRQSPFQVTLSNLSGELLDGGSSNGYVLKERDEIEIYESGTLIYNGVITKSRIPIKPESDRVLTLTGVSFWDFWGAGRVWEKNYHAHEPVNDASDIVKDAVDNAHADFTTTNVESDGQDIRKDFIGTSSLAVVAEMCKLLRKEFFVDKDKKARWFDVGSKSTGLTIDETKLAGEGYLEYDASESNYDQFIAVAGNKVFAPSTGSFADDINYWEITPTVGGGNGYLSIDDHIAGAIPAVTGSSKTSSLDLEIESRAGGDTLGLVEADWTALYFVLYFNFTNLTSFKIRLKDDASNDWLSENFASELTAAQVNALTIFLPSTGLSRNGFWTTTGSPDTINMIEFQFDGSAALSSDFSKYARIGNPVLYSILKSSINRSSSVPSHKRQKLIYDRHTQDKNVLVDLATSERDRLENSNLLGYLPVEGSSSYWQVGYNMTVNFANRGFSNKVTRVDKIRHEQVDGDWITKLYFAPSSLESPMYSNPAIQSLRKPNDIESMGAFYGWGFTNETQP